MKKCEGSGGAEIMEKAAETEKTAVGGRKRKFVLGESELSTASVQFKTRRSAVATPDSLSSPRENGLTLEFFATSAENWVDFSDRRERSELSEVQGESASTARLFESISHRCSTSDKMPSLADIEEFFASAEKNLQKQFLDKYNYDIAKDLPTEGRYEWVPLNSTTTMMKKIKSDRH